MRICLVLSLILAHVLQVVQPVKVFLPVPPSKTILYAASGFAAAVSTPGVTDPSTQRLDDQAQPPTTQQPPQPSTQAPRSPTDSSNNQPGANQDYSSTTLANPAGNTKTSTSLPPSSPNSSTNEHSNPTRAPNYPFDPSSDNNNPKGTDNTTKRPDIDQTSASHPTANYEWSAFLYSLFIIYVSMVKLIYHSVGPVRRNLAEPGILMVFGMLWELVNRQLDHGSSPRFNSKIFFYLFLPSTVLDQASLLSNKWLFLNIIPILIHSIIGTLVYATLIALTMFSLSQQSIFDLDSRVNSDAVYGSSSSLLLKPLTAARSSPVQETPSLILANEFDTSPRFSSQPSNLTLADCSIFGTILSSVDSSIMLDMFRSFQVHEKLQYLILGENLLNNAVVLVAFDLLLTFADETKPTVSQVYLAVLQFFLIMIGSIIVGFLLATLTLIAVRLSKYLQAKNVLLSYQKQCHAIVETLLILKMAYLSYTVAWVAGTSSIVSLATFGILNDQYIRHNLNLRSQLTLRQVILATKTLGQSLVYPLLGMLLVEIAYTNPPPPTWAEFLGLVPRDWAHQSSKAEPIYSSSIMTSDSSVRSNHHSQWNLKLLALVGIITIAYRFVTALSLGYLCNLLMGEQNKLRVKEQIVFAFGGLKGPLAFALVNRLIERDKYSDKLYFIHLVLVIIFASTVVMGSLIKPLLVQVQLFGWSQRNYASPSMVFDEIDRKVCDNLTQGLNSIVGRSKSSCERFIELNELHLKPWLSHDNGANINWLCIYYDELTLNETLNANSFHRSFQDPKMQFYWHLVNVKTSPTINRNQTSGRWRNNAAPPLSIIEEHNPLRLSHVNELNQPAYNSIQQSPGTRLRKRPKVATQNRAQSPLKEFVMLDLKMEDARVRRQASQNRPLNDNPLQRVSVDRSNDLNKVQRMLSSSLDEDQSPIESNSNFNEKDRFLLNLERRMRAIDEEEDDTGWTYGPRDLDRIRRKTRRPIRVQPQRPTKGQFAPSQIR